MLPSKRQLACLFNFFRPLDSPASSSQCHLMSDTVASTLTSDQAVTTMQGSATPFVLVTSPSPNPALSPSRNTAQTISKTEESSTPTMGPNSTALCYLSSTSLHETRMRQVLDEDQVVSPRLKIPDLEIILEEELNKHQHSTIEKKHARLRRLLDLLLQGVVSASSHPFSGSKRLEGFVMIEKFYWKVQSKSGIRFPLDGLLAEIGTVVTRSSGGDGGYARRLARDFDGRFTSRIPWDAIWWDYLLDLRGVNRYGLTRPPIHEIVSDLSQTSNGKYHAVSVLCLPPEIIRNILHLGAESFLPIARSSLNDRRIFHLRRSHFLTNAALTHSIFRRQAQFELVSFPYCRRGCDLHDLLEFVEVENISGSLRRIRLDFDDEEGEDEEEVFGDSLVRLSQSHPELQFIDFGGTFSAKAIALFEKCKLQSFQALMEIH